MDELSPEQAIRRAISADDVGQVRSLIQQNPELLFKTSLATRGWSWLHFAAAGGAVKTVDVLVDAGLPVDILDDDRSTPLYKAVAAQGRGEIVLRLLHLGANPNGHPDGSHPLHRAIEIGAADLVIDALIRAGADIEVRSREGRTPLMASVVSNDVGAMKLLLAAGADVLAVGTAYPGLTALEMADMRHQPGMVEVLRPHMQAALAHRALAESTKSAAGGCIQRLE